MKSMQQLLLTSFCDLDLLYVTDVQTNRTTDIGDGENSNLDRHANDFIPQSYWASN